MTERLDFTRVMISGGRDFRDALLMHRELLAIKNMAAQESCLPTIVSGDASGADQFGDCVAQLLGMDVERHPANWEQYGKRAGSIRNQEMVDSGITYAVFFRGGRGTADALRRVQQKPIGYHYVGVP